MGYSVRHLFCFAVLCVFSGKDTTMDITCSIFQTALKDAGKISEFFFIYIKDNQDSSPKMMSGFAE